MEGCVAELYHCRYWQDPVVLNKLSKAMGPAFGGEAVEGVEEGEEEEEEEEEDDEAETVFDAATSGNFSSYAYNMERNWQSAP